ncbi:MAG: 50S ribosomal protein L9 [Clostridiales bacterium]|jgi:large subunit ribosomal protein L9|nr:50S ribosomal protein L9 [Clostridiales bacterium]
MKVILTADVKGLGKKGELVNASDGYARNYLIPRKLAVQASAQALNELKNREASKKHKEATEQANAREAAQTINAMTINISANAGQGGKLFGSITAKEIAEHIKKNFNVDVDRRKISVEDIKSHGTYEADIKLMAGISAKVYVVVSE